MARSLLMIGQIHRERPPVFSVTSEPTPNVPFQAALPKPARPDLGPSSTDSFGALVDSNTAADPGNDRAHRNPISFAGGAHRSRKRLALSEHQDAEWASVLSQTFESSVGANTLAG